jgi:hypothetical protein
MGGTFYPSFRWVAPFIHLSWIHSGKLEAVDVSQEQSSRPRYRIDTESLARFKASRRSEAAVKVQRSQSKRNLDGVIQFF